MEKKTDIAAERPFLMKEALEEVAKLSICLFQHGSVGITESLSSIHKEKNAVVNTSILVIYMKK
ncbi:hypothetical protein ACFO25_05355 [Paenactinomyces guangxiensis]|uniref:Uncharacterized protein n=1 Tax=Paenactinomyces guangxiensis TaxID=1490290 RepID=A0A7W1WQT4_9BACL|nr:hypothetical protein [Paenactinomyces guangxiensis]MBA4494340.1 hypothetical protein [Paenactinomyces guangxiensis]MBH8590835.1 hypothetical protein [Paenactinomyces guangxiensis]